MKITIQQRQVDGVNKKVVIHGMLMSIENIAGEDLAEFLLGIEMEINKSGLLRVHLDMVGDELV